MLCRVCNSAMFFLEEIDDCVVGHPVLRNMSFKMPTCKIKLYRCETCSHIQSENTIPKDYYDNYTLYKENKDLCTSYYVKYEKGNDSRIQRLSKLACSHDSLLDIGCGGRCFRGCTKIF